MKISKKILSGSLVLVMSGVVVSAMADETQWDYHHQRRDEVNQRLENQNDRIHHEREDGEISQAEAQRLHHEDKSIRQEERAMAGGDHSHITPQEQNMLNHQENNVSQQIGH